MARILVIGTPRSGSTWTADILGLARGAQLVYEPDNAAINPPAGPVERARGLFPIIAVGECAADYKALWDHAFAGGWPNVAVTRVVGRALRRLPPRAVELLLRGLAPATARLRPKPQHVVAKSVYAAFSVDWLVDVYHPKVVMVERDPLNVAASWLDLDVPFGDFDRDDRVVDLSKSLNVPPPNPDAPRHRRVAWCVAFLILVMRQTSARHPDWLVVNHGRLIADPEQEFAQLFKALKLEWTSEAAAHIAQSNRHGTGFKTLRVRSELAEAWRRRLSSADAIEIQSVLAEFPTHA